MELIKEILSNNILEDSDKAGKYDKLLKEYNELERKNRLLVEDYHKNSSQIRMLTEENKRLKEASFQNQKKYKKKVKRIKHQFMTEIVYLKSGNKYNIYELKKEKPQNIVKIL